MKKKRKSLTAEESKLWQHYTETISTNGSDKTILPFKKSVKTPEININSVKRSTKDESFSEFSTGALLIDKKIHVKLKNGILKPERTLDLHGLTYDNAYSRVLRFVKSGYQDGKRLLLVITGKGKNPNQCDSFSFENQRGILNQAFPNWLQGNQLKHLILNVSQAHISHGGVGAYYVYLRKKNYKM